MKDAMSGDSISGRQCLLCGNIIDPVIEANRKGHLELTPSRPRPPGSVPVGTGRPKYKGLRQ